MNKTALITGGAKRIGRALSDGLAAAGYKVVIHYNSSSQEADELAKEIGDSGGTAFSVQANLFDENDTRNLVGKATELVGPIGMVINNASLFEDDSLGQINDELWDNHFKIHVKAPALLAEALSAQLADGEDGLIVNIIDQRVWRLTPNFTSYTLSKSALWTATRTMAQALAPKIRVNAIGPGPTLPSYRQTQADFDSQVDKLLLKRAPSLQEMVDTVLYFASAKSVTGQMIALDGGQHLAWQTPDQDVLE